MRRAGGVVALAAVALGACGTLRVPSPPPSPPLVRPVDARVGTAVTAEARLAYVANPLLRIDVGAASVARLEPAFRALFTETVALPDWPPWRTAPPATDGVIELQRVEAELVVGSDTGDRPDVASVRLHVCLYATDATELRCWKAAARQAIQRGPLDCVDLGACLASLVEVAVREAAARFLLEAERDPALRDWAAGARARQAAP